jgi:hypothetical protein
MQQTLRYRGAPARSFLASAALAVSFICSRPMKPTRPWLPLALWPETEKEAVVMLHRATVRRTERAHKRRLPSLSVPPLVFWLRNFHRRDSVGQSRTRVCETRPAARCRVTAKLPSQRRAVDGAAAATDHGESATPGNCRVTVEWFSGATAAADSNGRDVVQRGRLLLLIDERVVGRRARRDGQRGRLIAR